MHELSYLDHLLIIATNWGILFVLFGLAVSGAGLVILIRAIGRERPARSWEQIVGGALLIVCGLMWSYLQTLVPTRYALSPVRRLSNEQVVARAAPLYQEHCSVCHGTHGRGDGQLAPFLIPPPADFGIHGWHHREGEHYWWITRGIPGSSMPAFGDFFTEEERWLLARYIKILGREARFP